MIIFRYVGRQKTSSYFFEISTFIRENLSSYIRSNFCQVLNRSVMVDREDLQEGTISEDSDEVEEVVGEAVEEVGDEAF